MSYLDTGGGGVTDGDKGDVVVSSSGAVWTLDVTGTPTGAKFLRDDFSWQAIPGGGDMLASTYDPTAIASDAFARANHTGTQTLSTISDSGDLAALNVAFLTTAAIGSQTESTVDTLYRDTSTGRRYVTTAVDTFNEIFVAGVSTIASDATVMSRISGSTYSTVQHAQDIFHSAGYTSGGTISDGGSNTVNVAAGTGLIRATADPLDTLLWFDFGSATGLSVPANTRRYIGVEYNAGSPQVVVRTSYNWDLLTDFPLGQVYNEGGTLHIENAPHAVGDHASQMIQRSYETMPFTRDKRGGGLILGATNRNITLTAGAIWDRLKRFTISALDTSVADTFDAYYRDGVGGWTKQAAQTQYNNTQYDDGSGTLATLSTNRYGNHWFYVEPDGSLICVYGLTNGTLAQAEAASPPSSIPPRIQNQSVLLGRVIFQESQASAYRVDSAFTATLSVAGVSDHGNLAGLSDDDHTQYHTDARADTWLATAQANITGVGTVTSGTWEGADVGVLHGGTGASTAAAARTNLGVNWTKGMTLLSPTSSEDISLFFTEEAITITKMVAVLVGSSTPSVTWTVRHGTDRSAAGSEVVTGGTTTTSITTGSVVTSFNDETIVADSFVWLETTAQSGTVDLLNLTIFYTKDN